ncbi:uncharacterized protein mRpL34 [Euwallacea fornicatus]|uniref:uncharacterized protein mRpL34 n=1 Tax=Euwallacea fornicatus TaxID=995702 RepID=UPI00338E1BAB
MSMIGRIVSAFLNPSRKLSTELGQISSNFHSVASTVQHSTQLSSSPRITCLFNITSRSIVRYHFPRPSERKRIKKHGYKARLSTPAGRRVLMNRILKGRWVYSH